jgi:hypothetical protein
MLYVLDQYLKSLEQLFFGTFAKRDYKLGHVLLRHVVSCLPACRTSPTQWTVNFFYIWVFFENMS